MGRFVFRLEKVLRYREHLEKNVRQKLRIAREVCASKERALMDVNLKRNLAEKRCAGEEEKGLEVATYHLYRNFIEHLSRELEDASQSLRGAKEEVRAVEKAWLIASSNKKSLENLRERQFLSHKETQEREDQKLLDELVILRRGQLI
jgi:flagellar export protein FliJ